MSYVGRMSWRMMGPALIPIVLGGPRQGFFQRCSTYPFYSEGKLFFTDLPLQTVMTGAGISLAMLVYQILRLWRWTRGRGPACYVCGCLLGRVREGWYGPYRKCLGCGKNHSLARGLV